MIGVVFVVIVPYHFSIILFIKMYFYRYGTPRHENLPSRHTGKSWNYHHRTKRAILQPYQTAKVLSYSVFLVTKRVVNVPPPNNSFVRTCLYPCIYYNPFPLWGQTIPPPIVNSRVCYRLTWRGIYHNNFRTRYVINKQTYPPLFPSIYTNIDPTLDPTLPRHYRMNF